MHNKQCTATWLYLQISIRRKIWQGFLTFSGIPDVCGKCWSLNEFLISDQRNHSTQGDTWDSLLDVNPTRSANNIDRKQLTSNKVWQIYN